MALRERYLYKIKFIVLLDEFFVNASQSFKLRVTIQFPVVLTLLLIFIVLLKIYRKNIEYDKFLWRESALFKAILD